MLLIYCFAICWFVYAAKSTYTVMTHSPEDTEQEARELAEHWALEQHISKINFARLLWFGFMVLVIVDIIGFSLTYNFVLDTEQTIYHKIAMFVAIVVLFSLDQVISCRQLIRITGAMQMPDLSPKVLERWIRMNTQDIASLSSIAAVCKLTASFQLLLYTVIDAMR